MQRTIALALVAALIGGAAHAQTETRRMYGPGGAYEGRIETDNRGTQRLYDGAGRSRGRAERDSGGDLRVYDDRGRSVGRIEQNEVRRALRSADQRRD